jgi:catechol 2,3-dioxygenase-like lactoylglutathione lyase family enzyme
MTPRTGSRPAGNDWRVSDTGPQPPGIFGVYVQVSDLDRSLSFYCDVLSLELEWSDGALAVIHSPVNPGDALVLREVGEGAQRDLGEPGVTRVLWRAADPTDLDRAQEYLTSLDVPFQRHREDNSDGLTLRDPDGVEFVLLCGTREARSEPPFWLYWYR